MAGRSQSLRPAYLGSSYKPGMPGRSLSQRSTISASSTASSGSDDLGDEPSTHPTTPSYPSTSLEEPSSAGEKHDATSKDGAAVLMSAPASHVSLSRPITIQMPQIKKFNSAPDCTPPEPLSARGDLLGGYFPLHEDPQTRIRRPHPFHQDAGTKDPDQSRLSSSTVIGSLVQYGSHMPVAYVPTQQEHIMSMGKYYPTNYERRKKRQRISQDSAPSKESSNAFQHKSHLSRQVSAPGPSFSRLDASSSGAVDGAAAAAPIDEEESAARQRVLQYQHDMVAQTAIALGKTAKDILQTPVGMRVQDKASHQSSRLPRRATVQPRSVPSGETRTAPLDSSDDETLARLAEKSLRTRPRVPGNPGPVSGESHSRQHEQNPQTLREASAWLSAFTAFRRPESPRLLPMGSPGPVTPMALDPNDAKLDFLDLRGRASLDERRRGVPHASSD